MSRVDPLTRALDPDTGLPRCVAKNRLGTRCKNSPIPGGTVCKFHGGAAPQVKKKANLRLLELVEPAIATLAREMVNQNASPHVRLRAAENVLDRTGYSRKVDVSESEAAKEILVQRLLDMRAQKDDPGTPGE